MAANQQAHCPRMCQINPRPELTGLRAAVKLEDDLNAAPHWDEQPAPPVGLLDDGADPALIAAAADERIHDDLRVVLQIAYGEYGT